MPPQKWQRQPHTLAGAWLAIEEIRERIDGMQLADEVAERVKAEIEGHRMYGFTILQKVGGAVLAGVAFADFLLSILHVTHG